MVDCEPRSEHRWRLEEEITDKTKNLNQKCMKCGLTEPAKKDDLMDNNWLAEYQLIHEKVNTLDRITFELRVAFIGSLSFLTGSTGLLSTDIINLQTVQIANYAFPIHIFFSLIGLILVGAAAIFDMHYRSVLYNLEQRGKLIEYYNKFDTIRRISKKGKREDYQKWTFVIFYIVLALILAMILYWSIPLIEQIFPTQ